jgi:hypothetical protein
VVALRGTIPPSKGVGTASVPGGDVSVTAKTAPPDRDIPLGLTALSPFQGGISIISFTFACGMLILVDFDEA